MAKLVEPSGQFAEEIYPNYPGTDVLTSVVANAASKGFQKPTDTEILNGNRSTDAWYLKYIERYKDDPDYDELVNNPWLLQNQAKFSPNFLQYLGRAFGDTSAEDSYYSNILSQRNEYLNKWIAKRNERIKNEPAYQAQLMATAGQNPDLLGTSGVAHAPEDDEPLIGNHMPGAGEGISDVIGISFQVAQSGISLVSSVMSMAQGIQSMRFGEAQLVAQDLSNRKDAMAFLNDEMLNTLGISDISDIDKIDSTVYLRTLDDILKDRSLSPSTRKVLSRYRNSLQGESGNAVLHTMKMELAQRYHKSRQGTAQIFGDPLFDKDFDVWVEKLADYYNKYVLEVNKLAAKAQNAQNKYTSEYYKNLDPDKAANYENTAYDANSLAAENSKLIDQLYNDIYNFLSSEDKWYSKLALAFLPALRSYIMSMSIPSLNFSRPTTVNNNNTVNNNDNRATNRITNVNN